MSLEPEELGAAVRAAVADIARQLGIPQADLAARLRASLDPRAEDPDPDVWARLSRALWDAEIGAGL